MSKRSLTLLETLIAIVLVLAMGALIFPSFMSSLDERSFESAADDTNEQLLLARAHAQATGKPVEVTYNRDKSQVQARWFLRLLPDFSTQNSETSARKSARDNSYDSETSQESDDDALIGQSWACRDLGRSVRFATRPPNGETSGTATPRQSIASASEEYETLESLSKGQDVRLAVFMPDGSALVGDRVWLNDDKGRVGVFTIDPWSGLPIFKRLADQNDSALGDLQLPNAQDEFRSSNASDATGSRTTKKPSRSKTSTSASDDSASSHGRSNSGSDQMKDE